MTEERSGAELTAAEGKAVALLYGKPLDAVPEKLFIPPRALKVFLESFEGPLDLLLWLIRKQRFNIMDIPMALLTEQYMRYVDLLGDADIDLAGDYLAMASHLMAIKSSLLLPKRAQRDDAEPEDPRAELMRRIAEYERMKLAAQALNALPICSRDFSAAMVEPAEEDAPIPEASLDDLAAAWRSVVSRMGFRERHKVTREEISIREHMTRVLRELSGRRFVEFSAVLGLSSSREEAVVFFLAILELAKEGALAITQAAPFAPIWLTAKSQRRAGSAPQGDLLS